MAELLSQIFALSDREQIQIALAILQHIQENADEESSIPQGQLEQVEKTFREIEAGQMKTYSLEEFKARLEKRIAS